MKTIEGFYGFFFINFLLDIRELIFRMIFSNRKINKLN